MPRFSVQCPDDLLRQHHHQHHKPWPVHNTVDQIRFAETHIFDRLGDLASISVVDRLPTPEAAKQIGQAALWRESALWGTPYEALVENRKIVVESNVCPGLSSVVGKLGRLGESGKCCVSKVNASV